jgi:hypothetical protein
MTTVSGGTSRPLDFSDLEIGGLLEYRFADVSPTSARYYDNANNFAKLTGFGLTFNAQNELLSGTVTDVLIVTEGSTALKIAGANVAATTIFDYAQSNDTTGLLSIIFRGADTMTGTNLNDFVQSYAGNTRCVAGQARITLMVVQVRIRSKAVLAATKSSAAQDWTPLLTSRRQPASPLLSQLPAPTPAKRRAILFNPSKTCWAVLPPTRCRATVLAM